MLAVKPCQFIKHFYGEETLHLRNLWIIYAGKKSNYVIVDVYYTVAGQSATFFQTQTNSSRGGATLRNITSSPTRDSLFI